MNRERPLKNGETNNFHFIQLYTEQRSLSFKNLSLIAIVSLKRTEEHPDFVVTKLPLIKLNVAVSKINCGDLICIRSFSFSPY